MVKRIPPAEVRARLSAASLSGQPSRRTGVHSTLSANGLSGPSVASQPLGGYVRLANGIFVVEYQPRPFEAHFTSERWTSFFYAAPSDAWMSVLDSGADPRVLGLVLDKATPDTNITDLKLVLRTPSGTFPDGATAPVTVTEPFDVSSEGLRHFEIRGVKADVARLIAIDIRQYRSTKPKIITAIDLRVFPKRSVNLKFIKVTFSAKVPFSNIKSQRPIGDIPKFVESSNNTWSPANINFTATPGIVEFTKDIQNITVNSAMFMGGDFWNSLAKEIATAFPTSGGDRVVAFVGNEMLFDPVAFGVALALDVIFVRDIAPPSGPQFPHELGHTFGISHFTGGNPQTRPEALHANLMDPIPTDFWLNPHQLVKASDGATKISQHDKIQAQDNDLYDDPTIVLT